MMRQITSVVKPIVPTIGNCATDQISAIASSTVRVSMRLTMKPTTMAEIENRKKNEEPRKPNCSGVSFSSSMIGAPARPTTILSAKFTSMNRNSRKVIFQAPFGVGCAVIAGFPIFFGGSVISAGSDGTSGLADGNPGFSQRPTGDYGAGNRITITSQGV